MRGPREDLAAIFAAAVEAGAPERLVRANLDRIGDHLNIGSSRRLLVAGAGKAAARMAAAVESSLAQLELRGQIIVPSGTKSNLARVGLRFGAHPIPDRRGEAATARLCRMLKENPDDPVLFLLSGGASSLLVQPRAPVTLNEKAAVTGLLLRSGADIQGINTVRKHLSGVKGGGLLRHIGPRPVLAFLLSDVIGDDPSVIGSGPTAADPTTFADAEAVLCDNSVISAVPPAVVSILREGQAGRVVETIKPGAPELARVENVVIGSNRTALDGAAEAARDLGYRVVVETEPLAGDTRKGARSWFERVRRQLAAEPKDSRVCIIAGGETTVEVVGNGKGGRNQEFALTLVEPLAGGEIAVLSAGTDGVDGPTEAAGAFADGDTAARADAKGLPVSDFLSRNDSYSFFAALRDLLVCGPTGTNLMDIKIALRPGN